MNYFKALNRLLPQYPRRLLLLPILAMAVLMQPLLAVRSDACSLFSFTSSVVEKAPDRVVVYTCPTLKQYSREFQSNTLAEIEFSQGHNEYMKALIADYKAMRDACRAIKNVKSRK